MPSIKRRLTSISSTTRIPAFRMSAEPIMAPPDSFGVSSRLRGEFERYVQRIHELMDLDRFGEIAEKSSQQALLDVARHGIRTQGDHGDMLRSRVLAKDL